MIGNFAHFAAVTPAEQQKFDINWSLKLTNDGGYIFALIVGVIIANVFPRFAVAIKDAVRRELYIKVAIVILGGVFALTAASSCAASRQSSKPIWSTRLQSRMGGAARFRYFDLRRIGGDRGRRRDPRPAVVPVLVSSLVVNFRRGRSAHPAVRRAGVAGA